MQRSGRMKKELEMLSKSPPYGISCWSKDERIDLLQAQILGGEGTPYHNGIFTLEIQIPERYPFEPPKVRFVTPIYHPNIDTGGRICLDTLKMPPKGAWKPCLNISTVLTSIQLLMAEPNPEDPLMADIIGHNWKITANNVIYPLKLYLQDEKSAQSNEYKYNKTLYIENAKQWTRQHAVEKNISEENLVKAKSMTDTGVKRTQPMCDVTNKKARDS